MRNLVLLVPMLAACAADDNNISPLFAADGPEFLEADAKVMERLPPQDLMVIRSSLTTPDDNVLAGTTGQSGLAMRLISFTGEEMALTQLPLVDCLGAVRDLDGDCADPGEINGDDEIVEEVIIQYWNLDGGITTSYGSLADQVVTFSGEEIPAPTELSLTSLVIVSMNLDNGEDARSGARARLNFSNKGAGAIGLESGDSYGEESITPYVRGSTVTFRNSQPVTYLRSDSPEGSIPIGEGEIFGHTMAASETGEVGFQTAGFEFVSTDVGNNNWDTCGELGVPERWNYQDDDGNVIVAPEDMTFWADEVTLCSDVPDEPLGFVTFENLYQQLDPATAASYWVSLDTDGDTDPDDELDDAFYLDFISMGWYDGANPTLIDERYIYAMPVLGNVLLPYHEDETETDGGGGGGGGGGGTVTP